MGIEEGEFELALDVGVAFAFDVAGSVGLIVAALGLLLELFASLRLFVRAFARLFKATFRPAAFCIWSRCFFR